MRHTLKWSSCRLMASNLQNQWLVRRKAMGTTYKVVSATDAPRGSYLISSHKTFNFMTNLPCYITNVEEKFNSLEPLDVWIPRSPKIVLTRMSHLICIYVSIYSRGTNKLESTLEIILNSWWWVADAGVWWRSNSQQYLPWGPINKTMLRCLVYFAPWLCIKVSIIMMRRRLSFENTKQNIDLVFGSCLKVKFHFSTPFSHPRTYSVPTQVPGFVAEPCWDRSWLAWIAEVWKKKIQA
jgi:hypothetical protein